MLAKRVNDNAGCLKKRGVFEFLAGKPAPTRGSVIFTVWLLPPATHPGHPRFSRHQATYPIPPD
ncbi:hypothetical protein FRT60_00465 [Pseudomonas haemolytica]|uniref:Uncharacterized protein n=1 Tax=Pseudomonas haemolytica TaxID=2600065 RepID=A0A5P1DAG4_9PSED|nr:hypothetical protein [Pseudomonas haemolytica]MRJ37483.1 hypothetical protein [Pseudomonas haemolytica]